MCFLCAVYMPMSEYQCLLNRYTFFPVINRSVSNKVISRSEARRRRDAAATPGSDWPDYKRRRGLGLTDRPNNSLNKISVQLVWTLHFGSPSLLLVLYLC